MTNPDDSGHNLQEFYGLTKANAQQIGELRDELGKAVSDIRRVIERIADQVHEVSAPNFSLLAQWSAVLLTIIGMVAAPCAYFVVREMARQDTTLLGLDTKLQREQALVAEKITESVSNLNKVSAERHIDAVNLGNKAFARVERLEDWVNDRTKADLEELRQRRMK